MARIPYPIYISKPSLTFTNISLNAQHSRFPRRSTITCSLGEHLKVESRYPPGLEPSYTNFLVSTGHNLEHNYGDAPTRIRIFSGTANPALSQEIACYMGLELGKIKIKRFADSEIYVQLQESVRGCDVYLVQPTCPPANENLMELLIMIDACRRASAKNITALIPYFGYARADRKTQGRESIAAKLVANLITEAGANRVLTCDLHSGQSMGYFDIPVDHVYGQPVILDYLASKSISSEDLVVVSPDVGGVARARAFAKKLSDAPLAIVDKRRQGHNIAEVMNLIGDVKGKVAIIVDDMIDTAGTIAKGAALLHQAGAREIYACCTHAVFSKREIGERGIRTLPVPGASMATTAINFPQHSLPTSFTHTPPPSPHLTLAAFSREKKWMITRTPELHATLTKAKQVHSSSCTSSSNGSSSSVYQPRPAIILPGLGNNSGDYVKLQGILEGYGITSVIANVSRPDWLRNAAGLLDPNYWKGTLQPRPVLDWYLNRVDDAVRQAKDLAPGKKLSLIGHSAGGWLARVYMEEFGTSDISLLLTLGTPHMPPPDGVSGVIDQTRGLLNYVKKHCAKAIYEPELKYVCIAGRYIQGACIFNEKSKVMEDSQYVASAKNDQELGGVATLAETTVSTSTTPTFRARFVGQGYKQVCGRADVWGDGVVPEESAYLEGALNIGLEGIYHSPVGSDDESRPWYGSPLVVEQWIQHLLEE